MTEIEVRKFLEKIKAHYQEFKNDETFISREWLEGLCPYDKEDVYAKFQEHIDNEYLADKVPKIHVLTKWLVPTNEKKKKRQPIKGKIFCRWCKEACSNTYYLSLHEERCLRLRYICKMCDLFKINPGEYFGKNFLNVTLAELDENYNRFILRVIEEEKKQHKLKPFQREGIKLYYQNALNKKEG